MNYTTPDSEIRKAFTELENVPALAALSLRGMPIYSICRFHLEMLFRSAYFREYNSGSTPALNTILQEDKTELKKIFFLKRISQKISFLKEQRRVRKYYEQFGLNTQNNIETRFLFLATSGFRDKNNFSAESWDVIRYLKLKNEPISFILPNFSTEIKRRKEYDQFFSLDLRLKEKLSAPEQKCVEDFKTIVRQKLSILNDKEISTIDWYVSEVLSYERQLKKIVLRVKPKFLIAKSVYSNTWIKGACKDTGTKVVEVQHGVFTADNFYYFPLGKMSASELLLPDFVFCFGKEWLKLLRQQSPTWNDSNSGNLGTNKHIRDPKTEKKKKTILIALQDTVLGILDIRSDVFNFLIKYAAMLSHYEFVVRPHPADNYNTIKENYKDVPNIRLSNPQEESSIEVLKKADIVISATSMLIYEALSIGIPVISYERFRYMTIPEHITFVGTNEDLYELLNNSALSEINNSPEYLSDFDFREFGRLLNCEV